MRLINTFHTMPGPTLSTSALIPEQPKKIFYIDNLKVGLITLVILHHALNTYGAEGGWYYWQKTTHAGASITMVLLITINQSFFMGFFFFLSAYFLPASYNKKGAVRFVKDRLLRLGIPLVFYSFIFSPVLIYLVNYFGKGHHITFLRFLGSFHDWIDFGVLWFVAALLLFTAVYVLWRIWGKKYQSKPLSTPSLKTIAGFAAGVGIISFLVRIVFPIGWILKPIGFNLAYFSQYVALFIAGLAAAKNKWLDTLPYNYGKRFMRYALRFLLFFPAMGIIQKLTRTPQDWFTGGLHWHQLLYAVWEQLLGFSIIVALLTFGKKFWNRSTVLMAKLSRNAFAVYIFHPLVLLAISLSIRNLAIDPAWKFLIVAPLAVSGSFLLASVITLIPGVRKII
ncbi:MAG TPA: acyltransferase [Mucilaginibacter sp.]|jgi:surface polysaccharide O-acyltransferase-like enzyme|nr:acyltransferase [Mucilaginibacter sp.]